MQKKKYEIITDTSLVEIVEKLNSLKKDIDIVTILYDENNYKYATIISYVGGAWGGGGGGKGNNHTAVKK